MRVHFGVRYNSSDFPNFSVARCRARLREANCERDRTDADNCVQRDKTNKLSDELVSMSALLKGIFIVQNHYKLKT